MRYPSLYSVMLQHVWNSLERDETGGQYAATRGTGELIDHALSFVEGIERGRKMPSHLIVLSEGEREL